MKKLPQIIKHEFVSVVLRKSFLLTLILVPIGAMLIGLIVSVINTSSDSPDAQEIANFFMPQDDNRPEGIVNNSSLDLNLDAEMGNSFMLYGSEAAAKTAIDKNQITAYYIVPSDYLARGTIYHISPDFNPFGSLNSSAGMIDLVNRNLVQGDPDLSSRLADPINPNITFIEGQATREEAGSTAAFFVPYAITILFYILIMASSSLMLSSVASEKSNRIIEILLTSSTPLQLLTGKIIALGLVGLLQTSVWLGFSVLMLSSKGSELINLPITVKLPLSLLIWGITFFILGYCLYSALLAGVGALVPSLRETSQATSIIIIPLIIPMMMISVLSNAPNGALAVFLSLFPLTAPVTMMTRLSASSSVPVWQVFLSIGILVVTISLVIRSVARMFHAQNLLSGQPFKMSAFFKALLAR